VPAPDRLLIATGNLGKVREFRELLDLPGLTLASLADFPDIAEVDETGQTFRANAMLKASGYARATGLWAVADDSGLEVDALNKNPGVYSARWAAHHHAGTGDAANNQLLLQQLQTTREEQRTARFVCVVAVADPEGRIVLTVTDTVEGSILTEAVGTGGFGYDPLFRVTGLGRTSAELSAADKHAVSHRGKASRRLMPLLLKAWDVDSGSLAGSLEGRV
jgi:XTP/dITP diphosphohydrolase